MLATRVWRTYACRDPPLAALRAELTGQVHLVRETGRHAELNTRLSQEYAIAPLVEEVARDPHVRQLVAGVAAARL